VGRWPETIKRLKIKKREFIAESQPIPIVTPENSALPEVSSAIFHF
jgi:hypothetical protein